MKKAIWGQAEKRENGLRYFWQKIKSGFLFLDQSVILHNSVLPHLHFFYKNALLNSFILHILRNYSIMGTEPHYDFCGT